MKTIESLPEEVLVEIFKRLDSQTLLNSMLVNLHWNQTISDSKYAMASVALKFKAPHSWVKDRDEKFSEELTKVLLIERKFANLKIDSIMGSDENIFTVVEKHKLTLKSLHFDSCNFQMHSLMSLLCMVKNLERVVFKNCTFTATTDFEIVYLKNLRCLKISQTNLRVLEIFSLSRLTSVDIELTSNGCIVEMRKFLSNQEGLKHLKIDAAAISFENVFRSNWIFIGPGFNLKTFSFQCDNDEVLSRAAEDNFETILLQHAKDIEELEIRMNLSFALIKLIVSQLPKLRKFAIEARTLPKGQSYPHLDPSSSIKEIVLFEKIRNDHCVEAFLSFFPNLEALTVGLASEDLLKFIARNLKMLSSLSIHRFPLTRQKLKLTFPLLKKFHMKEVGTVESFVTFFKENPKIERFSIDEIHLLAVNENVVKAVTRANNERHIEIHGGLKSLQVFFDIVMQCKWKNLRTINLVGTDFNSNIITNFYRNVDYDKDIEKWHFLDDFRNL